jgi:hypothetical protein
MFVPSAVRHWPTAAACLFFHTFVILFVCFLYAWSSDPNSPLIWLYPIMLDMPSSLIITHWEMDSWTTLQFATALLVIGGLQWTILGMIFDLFFRRRAGAVLRNLWRTNER